MKELIEVLGQLGTVKQDHFDVHWVEVDLAEELINKFEEITGIRMKLLGKPSDRGYPENYNYQNPRDLLEGKYSRKPDVAVVGFDTRIIPSHLAPRTQSRKLNKYRDMIRDVKTQIGSKY